jgi:hypothetical protein
LKDAEKQVQMVRESLNVAQSRQKSYEDKRRIVLSFKIRDFVYLKVSPMRGTRRFKVKGKLAPRYVRPFKIIDRKGEVAYQLRATTAVVGSARCVSCIATEEVLMSARGATTHGIS